MSDNSGMSGNMTKLLRGFIIFKNILAVGRGQEAQEDDASLHVDNVEEDLVSKYDEGFLKKYSLTWLVCQNRFHSGLS